MKTNALPDLPRPMFLSYARRDFRICYKLWEMMLEPNSLNSHIDQVLMDFPTLFSPDMKLSGIQFNSSTTDHVLNCGRGYKDGWANDMPGWMYAIGQTMIRCNSMLVVVTPNSVRSRAVETELKAFEAFPHKPLFFISVNETPIPDHFAKYHQALVYDLKINIEALLGGVLKAAFKAKDKERWSDAGILFSEALQMMPLYEHPTAELTRDILVNRGQADIKLGYQHEAVSMYEQALQLLSEESSVVLRASVLHNLGWAYATQDRREIGRSREASEKAIVYFQKTLDLLEAVIAKDKQETADALRNSSHQVLASLSAQLSNNMIDLIPALLTQAGVAENSKNWSLMGQLYEQIFTIYRLNGDCDSPIVADMLSAKARAERNAVEWNAAKGTLEFALKAIDEDDRASRAGLLYDLGCNNCRNAHKNPRLTPNIQQLWRTEQCWNEAEIILLNLCQKPLENSRYNYAQLANLCSQGNSWINAELSKLTGKEEQAMHNIMAKEMREAGFTVKDFQL